MFIGQDNLARELDIIMSEIENGKNFSMLFIGASGYGKTTLALLFMNNLYHNMDLVEYHYPNNPSYDTNKRFHIWDEIHLLESPEFLYSLIDSNKYTMIFITNEYGDIPEPLVNRCIPFIFQPYTPEELAQILESNLRGFNLNRMMINYLATCTDGVPRRAKILTDRLRYIFNVTGIPRNLQELQQICSSILNIDDRGLDRLQRLYLDYITRTRRAGIDSISLALRIPKTVILRDIEPGLLYRGLIEISSKGRTLNELASRSR
jgi:Holliday junction resolvasome RuvABC ATP-dependent DNA helicase subunit